MREKLIVLGQVITDVQLNGVPLDQVQLEGLPHWYRGTWQAISSIVDVTLIGSPSLHEDWHPIPAADVGLTINQTQEFRQIERTTTQARIQHSGSLEIENVGEPVVVDNWIYTESAPRTLTRKYGNYLDIGSHHTLGDYLPLTSERGLGVDFVQNRTCLQPQERAVSYELGTIEYSVPNGTRNDPRTDHDSRNATGIGTWESYAAEVTHSWASLAWSTWLPAPTAATSGTSLGQTRDYKGRYYTYTQQRERDIYSTGTVLRNKGASVTTYLDNQVKDSANQTLAKTYSNWVNNGGVSAYGTYAPAHALIGVGISFSQTRTNTQPQKRVKTWSFSVTEYDFNETKNTYPVQTLANQIGIGTWESYAAEVTHSWASLAWSTWLPAPTAATSGISLGQTRDYKGRYYTYTQQRERDIYSTGTVLRNKGGSVTTYQDNQVQSSANQTLAKTYSNWVNNGGVSAYGTYAPLHTQVGRGQSFSQTRTNTQPQKRVKTWSFSVTEYDFNETRNSYPVQTLANQVGLGQMRDIATIVTNDSYSAYITGAWTVPNNSTTGSTFTQARSRTKTYRKVYQAREIDDVTGISYNKGAPTYTYGHVATYSNETRVLNLVYGPVYYTGVNTSCNTWTPAQSTKPIGTTFTQTRGCYRGRAKARSYELGTVEYHLSATAVSSVWHASIESQSATGTKANPLSWSGSSFGNAGSFNNLSNSFNLNADASFPTPNNDSAFGGISYSLGAVTQSNASDAYCSSSKVSTTVTSNNVRLTVNVVKTGTNNFEYTTNYSATLSATQGSGAARKTVTRQIIWSIAVDVTNACLSADSEYLLADGSIKLGSELVIGMKLQSEHPLTVPDESVDPLWYEWTTDDLQTIHKEPEITGVTLVDVPDYMLINGEQKSSNEHRYLTARNNIWAYRQADELLVGDVISPSVVVTSAVNIQQTLTVVLLDVEQADTYTGGSIGGVRLHNHNAKNGGGGLD